MQKLFENWRKYLNEVTGQGTMSDLRAQAALGSKTAEAQIDFRLNDPRYKKQQEIAATIFSLFDLSGITGWPDFYNATKDFEKKPSMASAGWLILAFAGVIPVIGAAGRAASVPVKAKRIARVATLSGELVPSLPKFSRTIGKAKTVIKQSLAARALKEAFEAGVINVKIFEKWYINKINSQATRIEIGEAWKTIDKYVGGVQATDPWVLHRALDGQFKNIIKKFGIGIDPHHGEGGWVMSLAATAPKIWNDFIVNINKIDSIPTVATDIAVKAKTAARGGKALVRTILHEIGHIQLLKNFPKIGKAFLEEYHTLILKRISQMRKGLNSSDFEDAKELLDAAKMAIKGADPHYIDEIADQIKNYDKADIKTVVKAVQVLILEESSKALSFAAKQGGDIRRAMLAGEKQYNYVLFLNAMQQINSRLGIKTNKFYFLQAEEVFAELFEKSVRKRVSGGDLASLNFPHTSLQLKDIIDEEIQNLLEERLKISYSELKKLILKEVGIAK